MFKLSLLFKKNDAARNYFSRIKSMDSYVQLTQRKLFNVANTKLIISHVVFVYRSTYIYKMYDNGFMKKKYWKEKQKFIADS